MSRGRRRDPGHREASSMAGHRPAGNPWSHPLIVQRTD